MILNSKDKELKAIDPGKQLELLKLQCNTLAPDLYRAYALYLQVLRTNLLNSVRNTILVLITGQGNEYLDISSIDSSKVFQDKIDKLVSRCCSLLTIEHLIDLSKQLENEEEIIFESAKNQVSEALSVNGHTPDNYIDYSPNELNVTLSSSPPIENPSQIDNWFINDDTKFDNVLFDQGTEYQNSQEENKNANNFSDLFPNEEFDDAEEKSNSNEVIANKKDILQSLFSIASQVFESKKINELESDVNSPSRKEPIVDDKDDQRLLLPDNPQDLTEWISSFEWALSRRLRNLSHAINIELLRAGFLNSVVPVSVLDAVLSGQMITPYSESNLLKISVPVGSSVISDRVDIFCILIRLSDLEFDNPTLKNCRLELKKHQRIILKMVRQYRYWHSRYLARKIHQTWWQKPPEKSLKIIPKN